MNWSQFLGESRFFPARHVDTVSVVDYQKLPCGTWYLLRADGALTQVMLDSQGRECLGSAESGAWAYEKATGKAASVAHGQNVEQTNASIIVDGAFVKWYRNLEPGLNPDVEIHRAISQHAPVAPLLGTVDYPLAEVTTTQDSATTPTTTLAIVLGLVDGQDGFELATAASDFSAEMEALGQALRTVHHALAEAFGTSTVNAAELLTNRIPEDPAVAQFVAPARDLFSALGEITVQRIHGDFHLGQALFSRTHQEWTILDFEGEPSRPLAQRRAFGSVAQDLAGAIRSLDYAGRGSKGEDIDFLRGYGDKVDSDLLRAYLVDKALYEVVYEVHHRPDRVDIPLDALRLLLR